GTLVATAGEDGLVRLWEAATGKERRVLDDKSHSLTALAFLPGQGGLVLAAAGQDRLVRLWEVDTGKRLAILEHPNTPTALAASPDGKLLAVGVSNEVVLWDVADLKQLRSWHAHHGGVRSLAFVPGGKGLLSAGLADEPINGGRIRFTKSPRKPDDYGLALW